MKTYIQFDPATGIISSAVTADSPPPQNEQTALVVLPDAASVIGKMIDLSTLDESASLAALIPVPPKNIRSRRITDLHPDLQPVCQRFLDACHAENIKAFVTATYRSSDIQAGYYARGRDADGNVIDPAKVITNARPGESPHDFTIKNTPAAKAFDIAIENADGTTGWDYDTDPRWARVAQIGKGMGLAWGGDFSTLRDPPHFQID